MGQGRIQCQSLAAMTGHATEGLQRVGVADLRQVGVAGQAVFHLAGQGGGLANWFWAAAFHERTDDQGQQQYQEETSKMDRRMESESGGRQQGKQGETDHGQQNNDRHYLGQSVTLPEPASQFGGARLGKTYGMNEKSSRAPRGTSTPQKKGLPSLSICCTHRKNQGARAVSHSGSQTN